MESKLKEHLVQIADRITPESTLEDVYDQLSLLADIEESEEQEQKGETLTQIEVEEKSKKWLK
jgi:predicted transcriptional regulator